VSEVVETFASIENNVEEESIEQVEELVEESVNEMDVIYISSSSSSGMLFFKFNGRGGVVQFQFGMIIFFKKIMNYKFQ